MSFPIKTCIICEEEFELRPDKPGYANRCPECSTPEAEAEAASKGSADGFQGKARAEANAERRRVIRDMLYRKDS